MEPLIEGPGEAKTPGSLTRPGTPTGGVVVGEEMLGDDETKRRASAEASTKPGSCSGFCVEKSTSPPISGLVIVDDDDDDNRLSIAAANTTAIAPPTCPAHTTEARLRARIDWHVLPWLTLLYLLSFLDRVNIANAASFGMVDDLGLRGTQFNTALTIFFVPYILFEIPANMLLKRVSPRLGLPACCLGFGVVTMCQGFVQNYAGLLVTRFLLGLFESGFVPGCYYILCMWYRRDEAQMRFSLFLSATSLAGAFGGLLAVGLGRMDSARGLRGWRWVFIVEGAATAAISALILLAPLFPRRIRPLVALPSFPEQTTDWLGEDERAFVIARLRADQGPTAAGRSLSLRRDVPTVLRDGKVWLGGLMYFGVLVSAYGYAFFAPTVLVRGRGYGPVESQLRSVPPWAAAFVAAMAMAWLSDRLRHRLLFAMVSLAAAIAGAGVLLARAASGREFEELGAAAGYGALFLMLTGTFCTIPVLACWFNMNMAGHRRRSVGTAWQLGFGNMGAIVATYAFVEADAPRYLRGYAVVLAMLCLSFVTCGAYAACLARENRRRERMARRGGGPATEMTEEEKEVLGDEHPDFRYML